MCVRACELFMNADKEKVWVSFIILPFLLRWHLSLNLALRIFWALLEAGKLHNPPICVSSELEIQGICRMPSLLCGCWGVNTGLKDSRAGDQNCTPPPPPPFMYPRLASVSAVQDDGELILLLLTSRCWNHIVTSSLWFSYCKPALDLLCPDTPQWPTDLRDLISELFEGLKRCLSS